MGSDSFGFRGEFCGLFCRSVRRDFPAMPAGALAQDEIGLSISYALSVTQVLNWMVRNFSEMESNIVSVEPHQGILGSGERGALGH